MSILPSAATILAPVTAGFRSLLSRPRLLAGVMLLLVLAVRVEDPQFARSMRLQGFDLFQGLKPVAVANRPVAIVDIDERSLAELGQWPWPRTQIGRMVENLRAAGARVVGFDVLFAEPDRLSPALFAAASPGLAPDIAAALSAQPSNDERFADIIRGAPVVLGISGTHDSEHPYAERIAATVPVAEYGGDSRPFLNQFPAVIPNLDVLSRAAAGNGLMTLTSEHDGLIRRVPMLTRVGNQIYPALSLEMMRVALGVPFISIDVDPFGSGVKGVRVGPLRVPTDANALTWLRFAEHDPRLYVSAVDVVKGQFDPSLFHRKLVLVGTSASGLRDLRATPVHSLIPGVEIHAQLIDSMLRVDFLKRPAYALGIELTLTLAVGLILIWLARRFTPWTSLPLFAAIVAALAAGAFYLFEMHAIILDVVYTSITGSMIFLCLILGNYSRSEIQRHHVRTAFSHYLAPALVESLAENPEQLRLGGEERELTFLFTDIAGFTSLTECIGAEALVRVLNEYLDSMCGIVMGHGGTIDKIVGDAVHALFNAPIHQADHAARAVACALEMDAFCRKFAEKKKAEGINFGETRIGVNTGPAIIGNFGGNGRFDYTAHGDAINTAARLEGANKFLGTTICVAASTMKDSPDFTFRPIGTLYLKGKEQGLEAFEPIAPEEPKHSSVSSYCNAFNLLRDDLPGAVAAFRELTEAYPADTLIAFHMQRLATGQGGCVLRMSGK